MQSTASPDMIFSLYHSGAFVCAGIVAAYLALKWGSNHIGWLEVPGRAHAVTAILAGLAIVIVPATQGATPNASQIVSALGTMIALMLPGTPATSKMGQGGFASRELLVFLAINALVIGIFAAPSCSGAQKAAETAYIDCLEAGVKAQVPALLPTVENIIASGGKNWQAQLEALGVAYGKDALACSLQAAVAVFEGKVGAEHDGGQTAAGLAQQFIKTHGYNFR